MKLAPRLTRREKVLLGILAVLVAVTCLYVYVHEPHRRRLLQLDAEIQRLALKVRESRSSYRDLPVIEAQIASVNAELTALERQLPAAVDYAEVLVYLHDAAVRTGVRVTAVQVADQVTAPLDLRQAVNFTVVGSYPALRGFFSRLEAMPNVGLAVDHLLLLPVDPANPDGLVTAQYTLWFYTVRVPAGEPAPVSPPGDLIPRLPAVPGRTNPFAPLPYSGF
ncbi:MAG: type 4a pilus biogenesis protein PilO [Bacillota bacterium]